MLIVKALKSFILFFVCITIFKKYIFLDGLEKFCSELERVITDPVEILVFETKIQDNYDDDDD